MNPLETKGFFVFIRYLYKNSIIWIEMRKLYRGL